MEYIQSLYLELLSFKFSELAQWLLLQPFAHGDLKPDNIKVTEEGELILLDYDGMYVPAMAGTLVPDQGSPHYRHPERSLQVFDERIDDYSLALLHLSLRAIALSPELYERYHGSEYLLFSESEQSKPSESPAFRDLAGLVTDKSLDTCYSLYLLVLSGKLTQCSPLLFSLDCPTNLLPPPNLATKVTKEDLDNVYTDEYGVKYSSDRTRLLKATCDLEEYTIPHGVWVICDSAFWSCRSLTSVVIPSSVTSIGVGAFYGCDSLESVVIPLGMRKYFEKLLPQDLH